MSQQTGSNAIRLTQPDAGQTVTVPVNADDMRLSLGFAPDPNTVAKNGQNLEFGFEDGGKIVLEGYYDHFANKTLPVMITESGDELSGEDFLASLNEDLLTAAGPGAGAGAAGSGAGEYADDPGALLDGVNRLGSLGTIYWGNDSEVPEEQRGLETPGGAFDMPVDTAGLFAAGAFEDARPMQYVDGDAAALNAAQIHFNFTPTGTTEVEAIRLSGFDTGARVFIGDPANGGVEVFPNASGEYSFSPNDFNPTGGAANPGIYIIPPANSDADMTINAVVDLRAISSGVTDSIEGTFTVIVDAVADLPTEGSSEFLAADALAQANAKSASGDMISEAKSVPIEVSFQFGDWQDGSEAHYIQVAGVPADWSLTGGPFDNASYTTVDNGDGTVTYLFDVTDYASANGGLAHDTVTFNPHDWTNDRLDDGSGRDEKGPAEITISAVAEENPAAGEQELDWNNNRSEVELEVITVSIQEDTPEIGENFTLGTNEKSGTQTGETDFAALAQSTQDLANALTTATPLGVDRQEFSFNLFSDGAVDGKVGGATEGGPSVAFDSFPIDGELLAKLPGDAGYTALTSTSATDADGNTTLTYSWTDGAGATHVALVIVIEPTFNQDGTGSATMTIIQYAALQHDPVQGTNGLEMGFTLKVTDNDGDYRIITAAYTATDDVPDAGDNVFAVFDEKTDTEISGNVLTKLVEDHDNDNNNASYDEADSGSDGWQGGDQGVVSFDVSLPDGFSLKGQTALTGLLPGGYVILDANNNAQGTFTLNANGDWTFSSGEGQDVIKNFDFTVTYTVKDADGDTAPAQLTISAKAAPVQVGISGSEQVFESELAQGSVNDVAGVAVYTIQAYHFDGATPISGDAIYEDVTVTLKLSFPTTGGASLADFDFDTLMTLNPDVVTGYNASTGEITVKILAGDADGSVQLKLPLADDSLGGKGTTSDGLTENYTIEITEVAGATDDHYLQPGDAGYTANSEQETTIIDDGAQWNESLNNGEGGWEYVSNELGAYVAGINDGTNTHVLDGPVVDVAVNKTTTSEDAGAVKVTLTLNAFDGTATQGGAWVPGTSNGKLSETITFTVQLDAGNVDNGVAFRMTAGLNALIKDGKVTLELPDGTVVGASNITSYGSGKVLTDYDGAEIKITLTEEYNPSTDASKLYLEAIPKGDTVVDGSEEQQFTVKITESSGHESLYDQEGATVTVEDARNGGWLSIAQGGTRVEGTDIPFELQLVTTKAGSTKVSNANTQGDMEVTLAFTTKEYDNVSGNNKADGAVAGEDYLASLNAALAVNPADADYSSNAAILALKAELGLHSGIEILGVVSDGNGGFTLELYIPKEAWNNGSITFKVPTIIDDNAGEPNEWFNVSVKEYKADEVGNQEVQGIADKGVAGVDGVITDPRIEMAIKGDTVIWEEPGNGETIAEYKISFTQAANHGGTTANGSFEFDVTLQNVNAKFYGGDPANAPTTGGADYHWVIMDGDTAKTYNLTTQAGKESFIADLQAQLDSIYDPGNVTVSFNSSNNSLHFSVTEGTVLEDLPLYVKAIDDQHGDSGEKYKVVIDGLTYDPDDVQVVITDRDETTTILDGGNTGKGSGQWLGLERTEVHESEADVTVAVRLYEPELGGDLYLGCKPPSEDMNLTFGYSDSTAENTAEGNKDYVTSANQATIKQASWVAYDADGNVLIKYEGGQWVEDLAGDGTFEPVTDWNTLGGAGQLPPGSYWEASPIISGLLNDDRLTEGDEEFNIWIESVTGNESAPKYTGSDWSNKVNDSGNVVELKDDYTNQGGTGSDIKDGPRLESFVLNGKLREPEATGENGSGKGEADPSTSSVYTIAFTDVAAEDLVVELALETGGAQLGKDFSLGEGIMTGAELIAHYNTEGWPKYLTEADVDSGKFYVIVKEGESSANFTVNILHDHDTTGDGAGVDSGNEGLTWTITEMVGSEVQWGTDAGYAAEDLTSTAAIEDDMKGPTITIQDGSLAGGYDGSGTVTGVFQLSPNVELGEGETVTVKLQIIDSKGNSHFVEVTGTWVNGEMQFSADIPQAVLDQPYFYVRVGDSTGGETRVDPDISAPFIKGGPGVYEPVHVSVEGSEIWEKTEGKPESVNYTLTISNLDNADTGSDISFVIKPMDNTAQVADDLVTDTGVTVTLDSSLLQELVDAGNDSFTVEIISDADGNPVQVIIKDAGDAVLHNLTVDANGDLPDGYGSVTGTLPTANDDNLIEGDEQFTPVITNPSGVVPTPGEEPKEVTIHDNDTPEVVVQFGYVDSNGAFHEVSQVTEGEMAHTDGNYVVRVALTDGNGNLLELDNDISPASPVTIILTVKGEGVNEGTEDVTLFTQEVTLYPGDSLADVRVVFPEDFITDPDKKFTIEAEFKNSDDAANFGNTGLEGTVTVDDDLTNGVTITDHINGPVASLLPNGGTGGSTNSAPEDGSAKYVIKLDKALEEAAEVPMKLIFSDVDDTAKGMTPEDIESITIGGVEYTVSMNGGVLTLTGGDSTITGTYETSSDGNVISWQFGVPMEKGSSGQNVTVNFHNDHISEGSEKLIVEIVGTGDLKGELTVGSNNGVDTTVREVKDGPDVSLSNGADAVEGNTAVIDLNLTKTPQVGFDVTMKVADMGVLDDNSTVTLVYQKGGIEHTVEFTISPDGTFTITVPDGATNTKLEFTTKDNASTGANDPLEVSITNVSGGEAERLDGASYDSAFVEESYNSMIFQLGDDDSTAMTSQTELTISLGNINADDVQSIVYGGKTYTSADLVTLPGGIVTLVIDCPAGTTVNGNITVTFNNNVVDNKKALDVSASETGNSAIVTITDDAGTTDQDGPVFSVTGGAEVAEGAAAEFTIHAEPKTGFETSKQDITLSFKVTGDNADLDNVTSPDGYTVTRVGNTNEFTVQVPANTNLTDGLDIVLNVGTVPDAVIGTDNAVTVTLTKVEGGEASISTTAGNNAAGTDVIEGSAAHLVVSGVTTATEGGNLSITLQLKNADNSGQDMKATANIAAVFAVNAADISLFLTDATAQDLFDSIISSYSAGGLTWTYDDGSGSYYVETSLPSNSHSATINIPTIADGVIGSNHDVTLTLVDIDDNGLAVAIPSDNDPITVTVADAEYAAATAAGLDADTLTGMELHYVNGDFDGSGNTMGQVILGSDGDNVIHGGSGDDVIRGGLGDDEMWGGDGDDSFVWEVEDIASGGLDQILDFAYGDDKLLFDDLLSVNAALTDFDGSSLTLTVTTEGSVEQTVVVNFESNTAFNEFVDNYNSSSESDQSVLLTHLINSITGN